MFYSINKVLKNLFAINCNFCFTCFTKDTIINYVLYVYFLYSKCVTSHCIDHNT